MTYRVQSYPSLSRLQEELDSNLNWRPIALAAGHIAQSVIVIFDVPGMSVYEMLEEEMDMDAAREKTHKEPPPEFPEPEEEEEPDVPEAEEEEEPEEERLPQPPPKKARNPPRLPVRGAKHKTVQKRKHK